MTVEGEHVYRVSNLGVLVHNDGCGPDLDELEKRAEWVEKEIEQAQIKLDAIERKSMEQIHRGGIIEGYSNVGSTQYLQQLEMDHAKLEIEIEAARAAG